MNVGKSDQMTFKKQSKNYYRPVELSSIRAQLYFNDPNYTHVKTVTSPQSEMPGNHLFYVFEHNESKEKIAIFHAVDGSNNSDSDGIDKQISLNDALQLYDAFKKGNIGLACDKVSIPVSMSDSKKRLWVELLIEFNKNFNEINFKKAKIVVCRGKAVGDFFQTPNIIKELKDVFGEHVTVETVYNNQLTGFISKTYDDSAPLFIINSEATIKGTNYEDKPDLNTHRFLHFEIYKKDVTDNPHIVTLKNNQLSGQEATDKSLEIDLNIRTKFVDGWVPKIDGKGTGGYHTPSFLRKGTSSPKLHNKIINFIARLILYTILGIWLLIKNTFYTIPFVKTAKYLSNLYNGHKRPKSITGLLSAIVGVAIFFFINATIFPGLGLLLARWFWLPVYLIPELKFVALGLAGVISGIGIPKQILRVYNHFMTGFTNPHLFAIKGELQKKIF